MIDTKDRKFEIGHEIQSSLKLYLKHEMLKNCERWNSKQDLY